MNGDCGCCARFSGLENASNAKRVLLRQGPVRVPRCRARLVEALPIQRKFLTGLTEFRNSEVSATDSMNRQGPLPLLVPFPGRKVRQRKSDSETPAAKPCKQRFREFKKRRSPGRGGESGGSPMRAERHSGEHLVHIGRKVGNRVPTGDRHELTGGIFLFGQGR